jgi:hypothetical protein
MADRGMIFSTPMVRAILAGRKTQTRRLIEPLDGAIREGDVVVSWPAGAAVRQGATFRPAIAPGDRLWVRETWGCHWATDDQKPREIDPRLWSVRYFADDYVRPAIGDGSVALLEQFRRKRTGRFMPRWASRLTLEVTEVRIEHLTAISREDCAAEGHPRSELDFPPEVHLDAARDWYMDLWDSLNRKAGTRWRDDPWVIAYTFTARRGNIDA